MSVTRFCPPAPFTRCRDRDLYPIDSGSLLRGIDLFGLLNSMNGKPVETLIASDKCYRKGTGQIIICFSVLRIRINNPGCHDKGE